MPRQKIVKATVIASVLSAVICFSADASLTELKKAKQCDLIKTRIVKQVKVPRCYHEGLYYDGKAIWVSNGEGGNTWVVDTGSEEVLSEIVPVADFSEAITARGDGTFYTSEWYTKKIYRVKIEGGKMAVQAAASVEPAHPAGIIWNGSHLYAITWDRGLLGTRFAILEMDGDMNVLRKIPIRAMQEPCQLAWDGKNLWMSSWYDQKVYKIDIDNWEAVGYFCAPVERTTGVAWDGRYLWVTATHGDLYQIDIISPDKKVI